MKQNIVFGLLLLLLRTCTGCSASISNFKLDSLILKNCNQKIELRDSLYIVYTAKYWRQVKPGFHFWGSLSELYWMNDSDIKPYISAVFYSNDRMKMVFWLGEKMPNAYGKFHYRPDKDTSKDRMCPYFFCPDTLYSITPMIGIRDSLNHPWVISILPGLQSGGNFSKKMADREMAQFCFVDFKHLENHIVIQGGPRKGQIVWRKNGYNVQDSDFFEKCPIWEKDTVGADGLYPFQETNVKDYSKDYDNGYPCDKCYVDLNYPVITYPEYIIKMYK